MFYQGSLQEGISTAVDQQKLVICFVTDENDESQSWETDFLADQSVEDLLRNQAVALRLKAGSEEAGYLAQIFPLPKTPTVVIIKNGELKEYITPGVTKGDFIRRVQGAFNAAPPATSQPSTHQTASSTTATREGSEPSSTSPSQAAQQSDNVRRVLASRAKAKAQQEEAERKLKEEKASANEAAQQISETSDAARVRSQAELVKKKRRHDDEERQRILKRIEDDKAERRQHAAEREKRKLDIQKSEEAESKLPVKKTPSNKTSLQVRLFDGSTIRSRFDTSSNLKDVRKWVDETRNDGNLPYTFKQVLTPLPNRNIDSTEESKNLGELGLSPSSTLLLIPVTKFSSAYKDESGSIVSGNIFSRFLRLILGFFTWLFSLFGLGGDGRRDLPEGEGVGESEATTTGAQSRVRGFQNPNDRRRDLPLYNGNSLNYESRPDEDEK
ncbi:unnamed protein product [Clonostachys solani]|uniref:UBX domain-containing protein 2 n=1 Tax=Clonostachys solani TaxID=160281 RepID=A0A9N9VZ77_9HYPO|nr:unnamed protein product [Clonostachys solani]